MCFRGSTKMIETQKQLPRHRHRQHKDKDIQHDDPWLSMIQQQASSTVDFASHALTIKIQLRQPIPTTSPNLVHNLSHRYRIKRPSFLFHLPPLAPFSPLLTLLSPIEANHFTFARLSFFAAVFDARILRLFRQPTWFPPFPSLRSPLSPQDRASKQTE